MTGGFIKKGDLGHMQRGQITGIHRGNHIQAKECLRLLEGERQKDQPY